MEAVGLLWEIVAIAIVVGGFWGMFQGARNGDDD